MSTKTVTDGVLEATTLRAPLSMCTECDQPIPTKRLQAVPDATQCVPCLEASGDVARLKRFDETLPNGERVETMFTHNRRIEAQMHHSNTVIASEQAFNVAVGDDRHLAAEYVEPMDVSRSMESLYEPDESYTTEEIAGHKVRSTPPQNSHSVRAEKRWNNSKPARDKALALDVPPNVQTIILMAAALSV